MEFTVDERLTEGELKALVRAAENDTAQHHIAIARNDQIKAHAQMRLLGLELAEAERE
ncbi:hypothetical protein PQR66_03290 [Paraburkholderia agricolaris]|jgi:hypothetical protein|uniref:Uncharacterized protein n=1 Tax=Paraburkholderia agricolaris TaxID=2152888 RepID=A0ABW8ZGN0_9BURK